MTLAHIAGIPVEESLAGLVPMVAVFGAWCAAAVRTRLPGRRARQ